MGASEHLRIFRHPSPSANKRNKEKRTLASCRYGAPRQGKAKRRLRVQVTKRLRRAEGAPHAAAAALWTGLLVSESHGVLVRFPHVSTIERVSRSSRTKINETQTCQALTHATIGPSPTKSIVWKLQIGPRTGTHSAAPRTPPPHAKPRPCERPRRGGANAGYPRPRTSARPSESTPAAPGRWLVLNSPWGITLAAHMSSPLTLSVRSLAPGG